KKLGQIGQALRRVAQHQEIVLPFGMGADEQLAQAQLLSAGVQSGQPVRAFAAQDQFFGVAEDGFANEERVQTEALQNSSCRRCSSNRCASKSMPSTSRLVAEM